MRQQCDIKLKSSACLNAIQRDRLDIEELIGLNGYPDRESTIPVMGNPPIGNLTLPVCDPRVQQSHTLEELLKTVKGFYDLSTVRDLLPSDYAIRAFEVAAYRIGALFHADEPVESAWDVKLE